MVGAGESVLEKFEIQRDLGYDGIEFVSPTDINLDDVIKASRATKMPIHGLVNMKHWEVRMSLPNQQERNRAVEIMNQCILDVHKLGGDSVLLVPGRVNGDQETHRDIWDRSIACIRESIPVA